MNTDQQRLGIEIRPVPRTSQIRRILATVAVACALGALSAQEKPHKLTTVSTRKMADSVHAVIAADQKAYVEAAQRQQAAARMAPADGRQPGGLPGHAQLLRTAAQSIQTAGAEFSYTLRSLSPINPNDAPQTEAEQAGLEFVAKHPGENYYTEEQLGGRSYFTAVYAERATLASCVECHNQNPRSPKRDFKAGDVMGAIVVRVPLEF